MTWNRRENTCRTTRQWIEMQHERPQEVSPGRWRAMQRQIEQDDDFDRSQDLSNQNDLVFWVNESVR